jgi:hypothetical protein
MSRDDDQTTRAEGDDDDRALDLQIAQFTKYALPLGTAVCATVAGLARGAPGVVLVLVGATLVAAIAVFWASVRTLVGETPLTGADAYALGTPRAEEEQKRAVLRALKDVEFEHEVGKISDEDYQALVSKYRAQAKRLLRAIDSDTLPERTKAEALVEERLIAEGLFDAPRADYRDPAPEVKATDKQPKPAKGKKKPDAPPKVACAKCGTKNDPDARYCKKCGARQGAADDEDEDEADEPEDEEASS